MGMRGKPWLFVTTERPLVNDSRGFGDDSRCFVTNASCFWLSSLFPDRKVEEEIGRDSCVWGVCKSLKLSFVDTLAQKGFGSLLIGVSIASGHEV